MHLADLSSDFQKRISRKETRKWPAPGVQTALRGYKQKLLETVFERTNVASTTSPTMTKCLRAARMVPTGVNLSMFPRMNLKLPPSIPPASSLPRWNGAGGEFDQVFFFLTSLGWGDKAVV